MLFQYFSERAGVGGIISNVTQINKDRGPAADQLNGFQGGAWGRAYRHVRRQGKGSGLVLQFRWIREFAVTNRLKANTLLLGLTFQM
jgi:hypothetical protein